MKYETWLERIHCVLSLTEGRIARILWDRGRLTSRQVSKATNYSCSKYLADLVKFKVVKRESTSSGYVYSLILVPEPRGECEDILEHEEKRKLSSRADDILATLPVREARKLYDALQEIFDA